MRILANLGRGVVVSPQVKAEWARGVMRGVVEWNRILIRQGLVPPLLEALARGRVRYRSEPRAWRKFFEEFASALVVLERGWGDCDDLAPWLCADLREKGDEKADLLVYWRPKPSGAMAFHVQVRRGNGDVLDPSRLGGMGVNE